MHKNPHPGQCPNPHLSAPAHPLLDPKIFPSWSPSGARVPPHVTDPAAAKGQLCAVQALSALTPACCPRLPHPPPGPYCPATLSCPPSWDTSAISHQVCWALPGNVCLFPSSLSEALLIFQGQTKVPGASSCTRREALKDRHPVPQHVALLRTELMPSECGFFCLLNSETLPCMHQTPALPPITGLARQLALPSAPPARHPHDHLSRGPHPS